MGRDRVIADALEPARRAPDLIVGSWCGKKFRPEKVAARAGWAEVPAVRDGELHEIKSCDILQPGPAALTDGLEQLHRPVRALGGAAVAAAVGGQVRQAADQWRHHAAVAGGLCLRFRLEVRGRLRGAAVRARDGALPGRPAARAGRGAADLHPLRRCLGRTEGPAARCRDRSLRRPGRAAAGLGRCAGGLLRGPRNGCHLAAGRGLCGLLPEPVQPDPALALRRRAHHRGAEPAHLAAGRAGAGRRCSSGGPARCCC
jgi:hypothetical protein